MRFNKPETKAARTVPMTTPRDFRYHGSMTPRIAIDPDICHGKPTIAGTRTPVSVILGHLAGGDSFETLCREYDLKDADIRAAIAFVDPR